MTHLSNDNEARRRESLSDGPDAHGQAAMLLVESLIHGLIAQSVIQVQDAIDMVTIAIDAKVEISADLGEGADTGDKSLGLLTAVRHSLGNDTL